MSTNRVPGHYSKPEVRAVQHALRDRDPFHCGICTVPDYQRLIYYSHGDTFRRVDFSSPSGQELDVLYQACKPAEFGRNGENVLDESYRKTGKLDLSSFATPFDPRSLGIHDQVIKTLLTESSGSTMEMELYKLNVYGPGDFFKAHQDTSRSKEMFGSLVVVLPTKHDGVHAASEPSICFVAFFGDIEHEVLPVISGYRVTLTYNLYHKPSHICSVSRIPTPFHQTLKQALVELLDDPSTLPNGGYLGFGLSHQYVYTGSEPVTSLMDQLKGADRALANVCEELGLRYCLKLFYRGILDHYRRINLLSDFKLPATDDYDTGGGELDASAYLRKSLKEMTIDQVEGVDMVSSSFKFNPKLLYDWDASEGDPEDWMCDERYPFLRPFYRDPVTEVLEITPMKSSSVGIHTKFLTYGNEAELVYFYGSACMLVVVDPAEVHAASA